MFTLSKKGFTLIELIVVMVILAILIMIAVPAFLNYTRDAQFTRLCNDARILTDVAEWM
jgi:type IV pilus assembly protein PilA